jgi:hypothetical protein
MLTHTTRSLLGRNHREINKEQQNFDYRREGHYQATGSGMAMEAHQNPKKL